MAVVQGIKERVHLPLYDSLNVEADKQLREVENTGVFKFFMNVQNKTKLETNLQSASLLPHYNTFEARAMRVVISDLPPEFPHNPKVKSEGWDVLDDDDRRIDGAGKVEGIQNSGFDGNKVVTADLDIGLDRLVELLREARASDDGYAALDLDERDEDDKELVTLEAADKSTVDLDAVIDAGGVIWLSVSEIEGLIDELPERNRPIKEQLSNSDAAGSLISKLIYNTVTTLYVGEKIMIQMPTWFFPAGAGPYSEAGKFATHGEPSPTATFRFAEPIFIDKQQNFRVEIEVPESDTLKEIQKIYGPLNIWVVLDGYMTRDVQ